MVFGGLAALLLVWGCGQADQSSGGIGRAPSGGAPMAEPARFSPEETQLASDTGHGAATKISRRMVVKRGSLLVAVKDVRAAQQDAVRMASELGGFVESSDLSGAESKLPRAMLVLRIPSQRFDAALDRVRAMGTLKTESISGEDVTDQYVDVVARIKVMQAEEESYLTMLRAAKKVSELLEIKERLSRVRQEIESLKAREQQLTDLAAMSTLTVSFEGIEAVGTPGAPENWAEGAWAAAVNLLTGTGRWLGQAAIYVAVLSPVWATPLLVAWVLRRRAHRTHKAM